VTSLRISLLGGFRVQDPAGDDIRLPGNRAALLLAYLALRPGDLHAREDLMTLLWGDRPDSQARGSLRQAVWELRHALDGLASSPLKVTAKALSLDRDKLLTDVGEIEALASAPSAGNLKRALALYRDRLLTGLDIKAEAFESFLREEEGRITDLLVAACTRLIGERHSDADDAEFAALAQSLLAIDPLQEEAHRYLIRHFASKGDIGLAARQYQDCCTILREELDIGPSPETEATFDAAKRGDLGRKAPSPEVWHKPRIAVLPFLNLSGDPAQEYFSDGVTEEIITALALWRSFPIIASSSSFAYKNRPVDIKQAGRELGARYILEGSLRRSRDSLRVTAQLIDAETGHHVWVEKFARNIADLFDLQNEIAGRIAAALEPAMGKVELDRSRTKPPGNLDAWDYCLQGKAYQRGWSHEDTLQARRMFEKAIELDPGYSEAYADLAWTHSRELLMEWTDDRPASIRRMYETARRAVELDEASSLAHYRLSTAYLWRNEHELAIAEGWQAVELNPMSTDALHALANKIDLAGDPEGIPMMQRAQSLSPLHPQRNMQLTFLARALLVKGRFDEAAERARAAILHQPDYANAHFILALALALLDDIEGARKALAQCDKLHPGFVAKRAGWAPYLDDASNRVLQEALDKAGARPTSRKRKG
jgi:TolB-like protein/Tfp pilus assembly protein PilF